MVAVGYLSFESGVKPLKKIFCVLLCVCLLCSCADFSIRREEDVTTTPPSTADSVVSEQTTTTSEVVTTTVPDEPEEQPTTEPLATEPVTSATEPITSQTEESSEATTTVITEPVPTFEFPEEFYSELSAIFAQFSLNLNCDGDPTKCTCNPEYEKLDAEGNIVTPRDRCMSIYFYDLETGYEMTVNSGVHYPVASVVKIPYCTMIYEKMTAGEIDPELLLTYEKRHYFHGTGLVNKGTYGDTYTVMQLLKLAITESDNTAYEMLKDLISWDDFMAYCQEAGYTHEQDLRSRKQKLCLESAGASGRLLANFLRSESGFVDAYKHDLTHTKNKMITSTYTVYRKYGWTNFAFHDVAYIDAPHPYVLVILSNIEGEERPDYTLFANVSMLIERYSQNRGDVPAETG